MKPKLILIVCWGNIYRSPVAEILLRREIKKQRLSQKIKCLSRGIQGSGSLPPPRFDNFTFYKEEFAAAKSVLEKYRIDLSKRHFRPIDKITVKTADIILIADEKSQKEILNQFPDTRGKIFLLMDLVDKNQKIEDPDGITDTKKYEVITKQLWESVTSGLPKLLSLLMIK